MVYSIQFSPTGGTAKATDFLASQLGYYTSIDLCDYHQDFSELRFRSTDVLVIGVPSFRGRVPALAAQRLLAINGNGARAVLVCVYGNREFDDTLVELQDICESRDLYVIAAVAAIAQHSERPVHAQGRPDAEDMKTLAEMAGQIREKVLSGSHTCPRILGNRPYRPDNFVCIPPVVTDRCTKCKTCAAMCPAQAISYANPTVTDSGKCISCMRCVKVCPAHARHVDVQVAQKLALILDRYKDIRKEPQIWL